LDDGTPTKKGSSFQEALKTGQDYEIKVAYRLMLEHIPVHLPDPDEVSDFIRFQKDIIVGDKRKAVLEVKSRAFKFTSPYDYPYSTVFTDTVSGWDAKQVRPAAVVIVSQETGGLIVVPSKTYPDWQVRRGLWLRDRRHYEDIYEAPLKLTKDFDWLVEQCMKLEK